MHPAGCPATFKLNIICGTKLFSLVIPVQAFQALISGHIQPEA